MSKTEVKIPEKSVPLTSKKDKVADNQGEEGLNNASKKTIPAEKPRSSQEKVIAWLKSQKDKLVRTDLFDKKGVFNESKHAALIRGMAKELEGGADLSDDDLMPALDTYAESLEAAEAEPFWMTLLDMARQAKWIEYIKYYTDNWSLSITEDRLEECIKITEQVSREFPLAGKFLSYDLACDLIKVGRTDVAKQLIIDFFSISPKDCEGLDEQFLKDEEFVTLDYALEDEDLVSIKEFLKELTDANAQFLIGCKYDGNEGSQSYHKAGVWYRRAVQQNLPHAMGNLSVLLMEGRITPESGEDWKELLKKSAEMGVAAAQLTIGVYLYLGDQTFQKDEQAGLEWIKKSAAQGFERAIEMLKEIKETKGGVFSKLFGRK